MHNKAPNSCHARDAAQQLNEADLPTARLTERRLPAGKDLSEASCARTGKRLISTGNATVDAQRKSSQRGDVEYTTVSVGVSDAKDQIYCSPVTVFGKQAEAVAKYVTKGKRVLVENTPPFEMSATSNCLEFTG